jgi:hypothetical protein
MDNVKLMKKEQYVRAMGRATDVAWKVGKKSGWELYYDKIGGMDYRKIEFRDISPGMGHSMVQFKAAGETCNELIEREQKRGRKARVWLSAVDDLDSAPSAEQLDEALARLYAKAVTRPWAEVPDDEKKLMRGLFAKVQKKQSTEQAWKATCTMVFASEDYALY